jgi:dephospho-CoA kinase
MRYDRRNSSTIGIERIIGLTGGVGMGKTTISNYLASHYQLPILDADIYARQAVEPGSAVLQEIIERYGSSILLPDGTVDRVRLGEIVFNNPSEKLWLEQRIHPFVRDRMEAELRTLAARSVPVVVLVIPLLFEARMTDLVTEVWVVVCPPKQQIERLQQRDRLDLTQIHARINSQMPIKQKIERADVVLENLSTPEDVLRQVDLALNYSPNPKSSMPPLK